MSGVLVEDRQENFACVSGPSYAADASVKAWRALAMSQAYGLFQQCEASLQAFLDSEVWVDAIACGRIEACVMLGGGGAPEKDQRILRSIEHLYPSGRGFDYRLIDASASMLAFSRRRLEMDNWRAGLGIQTRQADFLDIEAVRTWGSPVGGCCYFLTGGTFGNLDEQIFERAMRAALRPGDWLVLGVDTRDEHNPEAQKRELRTQYSSPEAEAFFAVSAGRAEAADVIGLAVTFLEETGAALSAIPGGLTVCVRSLHGSVARSTRYRLANLMSWWRERGWAIDGLHASACSGTYRQVVLRRL